MSGICAELRELGIAKQSGKPYLVADISRLLRAPEYAGLRSFSRDMEVEGVIVPKGHPVAKGKWPKIFTENEYYELADVLSENESWATDKAPKHLLTGILVCDECGTKMAHGHKYGKPHKDGTKTKHYVYRCQKQRGGCGRVSRNRDALEKFMLGLTYKAIRRLPAVKEKVVDATADEIVRLANKIVEAKQAYKDDKIDIAEFVGVHSRVGPDLRGVVT
ncbi:zinc ribbon domain-containing protein [Actinophytocola sp.]|uniref:zinc ribbon domain-containing protein n=1 Tax=Actinophytocola sp. TaxID=1872138 RepID=UPI0025BD4C08|nr:zinc ribbon domain-containing protein [Actinophytocola sp.]